MDVFIYLYVDYFVCAAQSEYVRTRRTRVIKQTADRTTRETEHDDIRRAQRENIDYSYGTRAMLCINASDYGTYRGD